MGKNIVYSVKNRSTSQVIYTIPEKNIRREFLPGETKRIAIEELEALNYSQGGRAILINFLQVEADEALKALEMTPEEEYYMNEEQVADLIKIGTYEGFLDCLDYAPVGVIDLIKTLAVRIPITDTRKIAALKEKTGFDAEKAIAMQKADETKEEETTETSASSSGRRTKPTYKVVAKEN